MKLRFWQPQATPNSLPYEIAKVAAAGKKQLHVKLRFWQTQSAKTAISHKKTPCEERSDEAPEKQTHRLS